MTVKKDKPNLKQRNLYTFCRDQSGVYGVMTALFGFALIGYTAFVVDGTGTLLDKARLNQGVEQAGLFLTTGYYYDNNATEHHKKMITDITRTYYQSNTPYDPTKITDGFDYDCSKNRGSVCEVNGYFMRPSWLYLGDKYKKDYGATFDGSEKVASNKMLFKKANNPMDIMFVVSLSTSMAEYDGWWPGANRLYEVKLVLREVVRDLLEKDGLNDNRVGVMGYSWGVALSPDSDSIGGSQRCYFPYAQSGTSFRLPNKAEIKIDSYDNLEKYIEAVVKDLPNDRGIPEATRELEKTLKSFSEGSLRLNVDSLPRRKIENNSTGKKEKYCLAWGGNYGSGDHRNTQSLIYWATKDGKNKSKTPDQIDTLIDQKLQQDSKVSQSIPAGGLLNAGRIMAEDLNPGKQLTQRKIIIISDGGDYWGFTKKLIERHDLCKIVTDRLDRDKNDSNDIYYISLSRDQSDMGAWKRCTGNSRVIHAYDKNRLLDAIRKFTEPKTYIVEEPPTKKKP